MHKEVKMEDVVTLRVGAQCNSYSGEIYSRDQVIFTCTHNHPYAISARECAEKRLKNLLHA